MGMIGIIGRIAVPLLAALLFTATAQIEGPREYEQPQPIECPPGDTTDFEGIAFQPSDDLVRIRIACFITSEPIEAVMFFTERDITQNNPTLPLHSFTKWVKVGDKQVAYFMNADRMGQFQLSELSAGGTFIEMFRVEVPYGR